MMAAVISFSITGDSRECLEWYVEAVSKGMSFRTMLDVLLAKRADISAFKCSEFHLGDGETFLTVVKVQKEHWMQSVAVSLQPSLQAVVTCCCFEFLKHSS